MAVALLAGCGTTVPLADQQGLAQAGGSLGSNQVSTAGAAGGSTSSALEGSGSGSGTSALTGGGTGSSSGTNPGGVSTVGSAGSGGGSGSTGAGGGSIGSSNDAGSGSSVSEAGDGPGVTNTTINVAGVYDPDAAAADSAIGAANANPGDTKAETEAVVNYFNAHGGIADRKVNMVWYEASVANSADQSYQAMCSDWTQDNKTFVLDSGTAILDQCTAAAHGLGLVESLLAETTPALQQYPSDIDIDGFTIDRGDRVTIEGLARQGYFSPGAKVGIATWDENDYHYGITNGAVPALAALGLHNVPVSYITVPQDYNDLGATSSSVASAVLQFHSEGIDHVILFDGPAGINESGVLVLEWMQQANSQRYYPKYGLNSTSGFSTGASDYPAQELAGSEGVGWTPSLDLSPADYDALPQSANQKACVQIMSAAGQAPTNGNQESNEYAICDEFFFLQAALGRITGPINQQSAVAAIDTLGSSFQDLTTFGTYFSSTDHDAAQQVRNAVFVASCDCYRYTSAAYNPG